MRFLTTLLLALGLSMSIASADGFPKRSEARGTDLTLQGTGVLYFKRLIPVYDAALYLAENQGAKNVLNDVPKRIEVSYRVGSKAEKFNRAGQTVLEKAYPKETLEPIRERLEKINALYPDPKAGDRCAITYVPGQGTELSFNGKPLGVIEGDDFARIYFSIWLGEKPASKGLRKGLLSIGKKR